MQKEYKDNVESKEKLVASIQMQIDRIQRMDDSLYDDKLSGDITSEKYKEKHEQFVSQKAELTHQLSKVDVTSAQRLEYSLVTQKAGLIYAKKTPEQKRLIINFSPI